MKLSEFCKSRNENIKEGNEFAPSFIKKVEALEGKNADFKELIREATGIIIDLKTGGKDTKSAESYLYRQSLILGVD